MLTVDIAYYETRQDTRDSSCSYNLTADTMRARIIV